MIVTHFYDQRTGLLARQTFRTSAPNADEIIALNTPEGHRAVLGVSDREAQRIDLEVAQRIDELTEHRKSLTAPEAISAADIELDLLRQRLIVTDKGLAEENRRRREERQRRTSAIQEVESLERLQIRSLSELAANPDDQSAREHFNRRKERIDSLRSIITAETDTTSRAG